MIKKTICVLISLFSIMIFVFPQGSCVVNASYVPSTPLDITGYDLSAVDDAHQIKIENGDILIPQYKGKYVKTGASSWSNYTTSFIAKKTIDKNTYCSDEAKEINVRADKQYRYSYTTTEVYKTITQYNYAVTYTATSKWNPIKTTKRYYSYSSARYSYPTVTGYKQSYVSTTYSYGYKTRTVSRVTPGYSWSSRTLEQSGAKNIRVYATQTVYSSQEIYYKWDRHAGDIVWNNIGNAYRKVNDGCVLKWTWQPSISGTPQYLIEKGTRGCKAGLYTKSITRYYFTQQTLINRLTDEVLKSFQKNIETFSDVAIDQMRNYAESEITDAIEEYIKTGLFSVNLLRGKEKLVANLCVYIGKALSDEISAENLLKLTMELVDGMIEDLVVGAASPIVDFVVFLYDGACALANAEELQNRMDVMLGEYSNNTTLVIQQETLNNGVVITKTFTVDTRLISCDGYQYGYIHPSITSNKYAFGSMKYYTVDNSGVMEALFSKIK